MRTLLSIALFLATATATAADIFFIQPAQNLPIPDSSTAAPPEILTGGAAWVKRVATMLAETGLKSAQFIDTEPARQTLAAAPQWKNLKITQYETHQAPALAQQLKTTDLNTLVIADAQILFELARTLGSEATETALGDHRLIHLLRIHQGKLVDTIALTAGE